MKKRIYISIAWQEMYEKDGWETIGYELFNSLGIPSIVVLEK